MPDTICQMRLLVLGGTLFVGRAIVQDALELGADVTLFGRGRTAPDLFPGVSRLTGDRDAGDYRALAGGEWDGVVDVSGYVTRHLAQAIEALGDRVDRYLFISSHAVYRTEGVGPGATEDTPRRSARRDTEALDEATYGPLKVACEDEVVTRYGRRATIVRPGKVAGPHDPSDVFTYWTRRSARGGRVALPGDPRQPVQLVDVRDLARLVTRLLADGRAGAFQAVGPTTTLGGLITTCAKVAGAEVEIVPVAPELARPRFPLIRSNWASQQRSPARARAAGMPVTPLATTAADVLAWDRARGLPPLTTGFTPAQERALLAAEDRRAARPGIAD